MKIGALFRPATCIAALGLVVAGEANAVGCNGCVMTLNAKFNITNLHPAVDRVGYICTTPDGQSAENWAGLTNHGYSGTIGSFVSIFPVANQTSVTLTCALRLHSTAHGWQLAVASAAQPVNPTDSNWNVVAAGATIKWTQVVTFPNIATP